jgi:hypothetical protein
VRLPISYLPPPISASSTYFSSTRRPHRTDIRAEEVDLLHGTLMLLVTLVAIVSYHPRVMVSEPVLDLRFRCTSDKRLAAETMSEEPLES